MKLLVILLVLLCGVRAVAAQDDLTVLKADKDFAPRQMLYEYLRGEAKKLFDARRQTIAGINTPEKLQERQKELKAKFIAALGGFPDKTPLKPVVVGKVQRDGYRIEKVIYESRPNHHVTATLYLPDGTGPFPGVLMPIGHSTTGKAADYIQRGSILLAKNGLAVLAYDPIGQGERMQLLDKQGNPAFKSSTTEHTMIGVGALLVGSSTASYRIWDGIRSLDYLASRPEIDAKKLGCTGCSGGGTLTSYLMALDERIVAAAPSCYITSLERLFETIGPQDAEQNITGQVAFGMEHADYLTMRAPLPTLICAASQDFFDIKGTWTSYREAKLLYGVLGHAERVSLAEYNTKHGYPKPQREAVTHWMRRWLLNKDDTPVEGPFDISSFKELQCTRTGQVLHDLQGKSVFHLSAERAKELAQKRAKKKLPREQLLQQVRQMIALPDKIKAVPVQEVGKTERPKGTIRKLVFETEPGIKVPALDLIPAEAKKDSGCYVTLREGGMWENPAAFSIVVEALVLKGYEVLVLDPRGMGETSPGKFSSTSNFGANFKETFLSFHLNRPLLGQRVYDVMAVIETMSAERKWKQILLNAEGTTGPIALHVAVLDNRITHLNIQGPMPSWTTVVNTPVTFNQFSNVVPGALAVYDLPDLAATLAPQTATITWAENAVQ